MAELCFSCFSQLRSSGACPHCGYDPGEDKGKYPAALKPGTILNNRYILGRVLGQGGFGITYAAQDFETKQRVAVKEYLPINMASREFTGQVSSFGAQHENFEHGKEGFMEEANALVDLKDNPYIVNVHDFFESNGTAYFVMEYVQGKNLKEYVKIMGGKLGQNGANNILLPIMEALEDVHSKGLVHRDIAPDNIIVTADGSAKLIDFGAARYSTGEKSLSLDVVLKHGYAPKEQYLRRGRQGPFTDVYAMAATYYYAVTGRVPPDALQRMEEDELVSPSLFGAKLSPNAENALMKALELQPADRYQTMGEFARAIKGICIPAADKTNEPVAEKRPDAVANRPQKKKEKRSFTNIVFAVAVFSLAVVMAGRFLVPDSHPSSGSEAEVNTEQPVPPTTVSIPAMEVPPTPIDVPERVAICWYYTGKEMTDFTMRLGDPPLTLRAMASPGDREYMTPVWKSSDEDVLKITVNEDGSCTCAIVGTNAGGIEITAEIAGVTGKCVVYCVN